MIIVSKETQAKRNLEAGLLFEKMIDAACGAYAENHIANIIKTPEPMRIIRPLGGGQFIACFTKQAQPDYKGTLRGGRAVCFEAKFTSTDRMEQKRVTKAQTAELEKHYALGALCFVVCGFASGRAYRVPWDVWTDMQARFGRKYVTEADLKEFAVRTDLKVWFLEQKGEKINGR